MSILKIMLFGRHSHRTPLAYGDYQIQGKHLFELVNRPEEADLLVAGFEIDFLNAESTLQDFLSRNSTLKCVTVSEEPLWDTIWTEGYSERAIETRAGIKIFRLNYFNSEIFTFESLPYYITTEDFFCSRYQSMCSGVVAAGGHRLFRSWCEARYKFAFMLEKRSEKKFNVRDKDGRLLGLSAYRSAVAEGLEKNDIFVSGAGWGSSVKRQCLPDWHLDKITTLSGLAFLVGAIENTYVRDYVSEKVFDAMCCGARPIVYAGSGHGLYRVIGEEEGVAVDLYEKEVPAAIDILERTEPSISDANDFIDRLEYKIRPILHLDNVRAEREERLNRIHSELTQIRYQDGGLCD